MTDVITIRRATLQDAEPCARILDDWIEQTDWMPRVRSYEDIRNHYCKRVFRQREIYVIGDPARAYISLGPEHFVSSLYCADTGRGYGHALLDHVKRTNPYLQLWTFVANTGARRFYEREGFVERQRSVGENEEGLPDILYRWEAT